MCATAEPISRRARLIDCQHVRFLRLWAIVMIASVRMLLLTRLLFLDPLTHPPHRLRQR